MAKQAFFAGLVFDELERPVAVTTVGGEAHYVVDDDGFLRHISSEYVDRQVLDVFLEQLEDNREIAISQMLNMLGKDDIFTKAAIDASLRQVNMDQIIEQGMPAQARDMMGMMGLKIIIDYHGDVVKLEQPTLTDEE